MSRQPHRARPGPSSRKWLTAPTADEGHRFECSTSYELSGRYGILILLSARVCSCIAPGPDVYEEIIRKLGSAGAFDLMKGLVREMRREGHEVKVGVVQSFVESYARLRRFDEAVRERMRGLVRGLEERAVLEPRPGRTAGEAARGRTRRGAGRAGRSGPLRRGA